jgi:hypothetical protein
MINVKREIGYLCKDLFSEGRNNVLFFGNLKYTRAVLKGVYNRAKIKNEFLCSWHDALAITKPMDFFEPLLILKYGKEYDKLKMRPIFRQICKEDIFELAYLCGREKGSKNKNHQRLPVIFIDGFEQLLFEMDYGHLDKKRIETMLIDDSASQILPKGFGDRLRKELHQTGTGIFYATVGNANSVEFASTLGTYNYLFNADQFRCCYLT